MSSKGHIRYRLQSGEYVPGTTTVTGQLAIPALIQAAWKLGMDGIDYKKVWGDLADIGTLAHYLISCEIRGANPSLSEYPESTIVPAQRCLNRFKRWWKENPCETLASEIPLVSEIHHYGGTPDWIARKEGEIILRDIKTGGAIYGNMKYQLTGYETLWNENNPHLIITQREILRFDRDGETLDWKILPKDPIDWRIFADLLEIYHLQKLERRSGR